MDVRHSEPQQSSMPRRVPTIGDLSEDMSIKGDHNNLGPQSLMPKAAGKRLGLVASDALGIAQRRAT